MLGWAITFLLVALVAALFDPRPVLALFEQRQTVPLADPVGQLAHHRVLALFGVADPLVAGAFQQLLGVVVAVLAGLLAEGDAAWVLTQGQGLLRLRRPTLRHTAPPPRQKIAIATPTKAATSPAILIVVMRSPGIAKCATNASQSGIV